MKKKQQEIIPAANKNVYLCYSLLKKGKAEVLAREIDSN